MIILALLALPAVTCRDRGGAVATSAPVAPYLLTITEATAYRRGRNREIALLRAVLTRRAGRAGLAGDSSTSAPILARSGAAAAGLPLETYLLVVARIDTALRLRAASPEAAPGPGSAEWAELDSLRVELTVLRSRVDALESRAP